MNIQNPILDTRGVTVAYKGVTAIEDISLSVRAGETFGLVGLNGAGKTSLIKCIIGLRNQDSGEIDFLGRSSAVAENRRRMAFLPERFDPPWFLSGMEFMRFTLRLYGRPFSPQAVIEAAERLALDPSALCRRVQTYSKGMRQKLGLMGTVMTGCDLMILDEPMSGLDPRARAHVKDMLAEVRRQGRTIFMSSHILSDMDEICDRIAVLHNRRLHYIGSPKELKQSVGADNLERAFLSFIDKKEAA